MGKTSEVKQLISRGGWMDINCVEVWDQNSPWWQFDRRDQVTALHWAAYYNLTDVVQVLLDGGAAPDMANGNGITPLQVAVLGWHKDVIKLLLRGKADPNKMSRLEFSPLQLASLHGNDREDLVQLLLDAGAQTNEAGNKNGITALHYATKVGHKKVVCLLLENGANVNMAEENGKTPLHFAAEEYVKKDLLSLAPERYGSLREIVQVLINGKADPNMEDKTGWTPLHYGISSKVIVQLLLDGGAEPNKEDKIMGTPLHWASLHGSTEVVQLLLEKGADPDKRTRTGQTPVDFAVQEGHKEIVQLLKAHSKHQ